MNGSLWCSPGVFMAAVDDDVVILDVNSDAYHCLIDGAHTLSITSGGKLTLDDRLLASDLRDAGLIGPTSPQEKRLAPISAVRELSLSSSEPRSMVARVGVSWLIAGSIFRGKSLQALLSFHRRTPRPLRQPEEDEIARIVGDARMARPWIPGEGACLQRSFQLRCVLARHGIATDWIFGVRTWPFGAHCWLQIGDLVVGDRLARVRRYTPIMRG